MKPCHSSLKTIVSDGRKTHKPDFDMKKVKIYLGINNSPLEDRDRYKKNIYYPKDIT